MTIGFLSNLPLPFGALDVCTFLATSPLNLGLPDARRAPPAWLTVPRSPGLWLPSCYAWSFHECQKDFNEESRWARMNDDLLSPWCYSKQNGALGRGLELSFSSSISAEYLFCVRWCSGLRFRFNAERRCCSKCHLLLGNSKWSDTCSYRMRKTPHTDTHILSIFTLNQLSRSQSHVKYERFYTDSWFMFKQKFKAHSEVSELGHWLWAHGTGERSSLLIPAADHSQSRWIAHWSKSGQHITYKKNLKHRMYRAGGGANKLEDN